MGWGNVSHSLALAQFALNQAGITNPTGAQLQAALLGNTIKTADAKSITFAGVLQQRADGMGWGQNRTELRDDDGRGESQYQRPTGRHCDHASEIRGAEDRKYD